jgi:Protein of unknown function (DUF3710)
MFRRRKGAGSAEGHDRPPAAPIPGTEQPERQELPRPQGPWDVADIEIGEDDPNLVDLGGMLVRGRPGLEMRLQVDEQQQDVVAVMLVSEEGAVELRAFAAPRNESIWDDVRREIGAEATRRGGTATEQQGEFGPELRLAVPAQTPDGQQGTQLSRIVGVSAPRWLLRGTFLGKAAQEPDPDGLLESAFRDVVVRRGEGPMAPRSPIPLRMPPGVQTTPPQ